MNDKLPPHSIEAEQGILGCFLLAPDESRDRCNIAPDDFYDLRHRELFVVILDTMVAGQPVDMISVSTKLKDLNLLDTVGGVAYLSSLLDAVPSTANLPYYSEIVKEKRYMREKLRFHVEQADKIHSFSGDISSFRAQSAAEFEAIEDILTETTASVVDAKEGSKRFLDYATTMMENRGAFTGIPTGWQRYDEVTWGWQPGEYNIVAARPGHGKTAVLCCAVNNIAVEKRIPSLVFSYEMKADRLIMRLACIRAGVNAKSLKMGELTEMEIYRLQQAITQIAAAPLHIVDSSRVRSGQIKGLIRHYQKAHGVRFVGLDYLQRIPPDTTRDKRNEEVAAISTELANTFKELGVSSCVLAQLNRDADGRCPKESDLGQSGQIETDADTITLLWKDPEAGLVDERWNYKFLIPKNRDGENGVVNMVFNRGITRFEPSGDRFEFTA